MTEQQQNLWSVLILFTVTAYYLQWNPRTLILKETYHAFLLFSPLICFIGSYPCNRSLNLKKSVPTGAPLSSWSAWNVSSLVPPLIPWLLDITMSHVCIMYAYFHSRREENWMLKTQHCQCEVTVTSAGSGVCELTNQSRLGIWEEGGLKETGAKTECLFSTGQYEKTDVNLF